jgi:hypothetical protein
MSSPHYEPGIRAERKVIEKNACFRNENGHNTCLALIFRARMNFAGVSAKNKEIAR